MNDFSDIFFVRSTAPMHLDWRTFVRPIGTKHATIAGFGPKHGMTVGAFVKIGLFAFWAVGPWAVGAVGSGR